MNCSPQQSPIRHFRGLLQTLLLATTLPSPILRRLSRPRGAARRLGLGRLSLYSPVAIQLR